MANSMRERLDGVPLKMLRKSRRGGESAPNAVQDARRRHADLLWFAARIAGIESDKELAAELGDQARPITKAQLSAWKNGDENPQTWRWEQHPRLGPALLEAHARRRAEADSGVVVTLNIALRSRRSA